MASNNQQTPVKEAERPQQQENNLPNVDDTHQQTEEDEEDNLYDEGDDQQQEGEEAYDDDANQEDDQEQEADAPSEEHDDAKTAVEPRSPSPKKNKPKPARVDSERQVATTEKPRRRRRRNQPEWMDDEKENTDYDKQMARRERRRQRQEQQQMQQYQYQQQQQQQMLMQQQQQQQQQQMQQKNEGGKNPLKLRLDLNLEVEIILAVFFVIFLYLHANHIRSLVSSSSMADTTTVGPPRTPTKKLFKASNKTKTPPVRRLKSTSNTPQSSEVTLQHQQSVGDAAAAAVSSTATKPLGDAPKLFRNVSSRRSSQALSKAHAPIDDIAKSTVLAPLTSASDVATGKFVAEYADSDTTGDTPIGLIDNEVLTLSATDTVSGSTGVAGDPFTAAPESLLTSGKLSPSFPRHDANGTDSLRESVSAATGAKDDLTREALAPVAAPPKSSDGHQPDESGSDDVLGQVSTSAPHDVPTDAVSDSLEKDTEAVAQPTDFAQDLADHGNRELGEFVKALTAKASQSSPNPVSNSDGGLHNDIHDTAPNIAEEAQTVAGDSMYLPTDPMGKLPANDAVVNDGAQKTDNQLSDAPLQPDVAVAGQEAGDVSDAKATVQDTSGIEALKLPDPVAAIPAKDVTGEPSAIDSSSTEAPAQLATGELEVGDTAQNITSAQTAYTNGDKGTTSGVTQTVSDVEPNIEANLPASTSDAPVLPNVSGKVQGATGDASKGGPKMPPYPDLLKNAEQIREGVAGFMRRVGSASQQPRASSDSGQVNDTPEDMLQTANDASSNALRMPDPLKASEEVKGTASETSSAPTQVNNLGRPSRIQRQMEFPIPLPDRTIPSKPSTESVGNTSGLPSVESLRSTDGLPSTEGLASTDSLEDPPEEFLDPEVHSPRSASTIISPVPRISQVTPITSQPPPDLSQLVKGLEGKTVDDVGNIVDEAGNVLGHATGDLPSMMGKTIADNGEVYGDNGELIGFVVENFTGQTPRPTSPKPTPLPGGLMVDTQGNIMDSSGNIIGKLNNSNAGEQSSHHKISTAGSSSKYDEPMIDGQQEDKDKDEDKEKKENKGIPADIFLDVKSTPEGIQLTIRIPTVFAQEPRK